MNEAKKYISDLELTDLLKIPKEKISNLVEKLPNVKVGDRFFVPCNALEQYGVNTVSNQESIKISSINKKPSKP